MSELFPKSPLRSQSLNVKKHSKGGDKGGHEYSSKHLFESVLSVHIAQTASRKQWSSQESSYGWVAFISFHRRFGPTAHGIQ